MEIHTETQTASLPLGWYFAWLSKLYVGVLTKKLDKLDIDRYFVVLLLLERAGKPVCQQTLCDTLHIDKTYMVKIVDYLDKYGYISRQASEKDRRRQLITLTDKAKSVMPDIENAIREIDRDIIEKFAQTDIDQLKSQLEILGGGLMAAPHIPVQVNYKRNKK